MANSGPKIVFKDKKLLYGYDSRNRSKLPTVPSYASENIAFGSIGTEGTFITQDQLPDREGLRKLTPFIDNPSKVVTTTTDWLDLLNTGNDLKVPQDWRVIASCYVNPQAPVNRFNCQLNVVDFNTNLGIGSGSSTQNLPEGEWTRIWFSWQNTSGSDRIVTATRIEPYNRASWTNSAISCYAVNFQVEVVPPEITQPTPYNGAAVRSLSNLKSTFGDSTVNLNTSAFTSNGAYVFFDGTGEVDGSPTGSYIAIPNSLTTTNPDVRPNGLTYTWWQYSLDLTRRSVLWGAGTINHLETAPPDFRTEAVLQNGFSFGASGANQEIGVWEHYAIKFDNANTTVTWFKNGQQFWSGSLINGLGQTDYFQPSAIGRATGDSAYFYAQSFYGFFDHFYVYDGVLTDAEVETNYNAHKGHFEKLNGTMPTSGYASDHIPLQANVTLLIRSALIFNATPVSQFHGTSADLTDVDYRYVDGNRRYVAYTKRNNSTNGFEVFFNRYDNLNLSGVVGAFDNRISTFYNIGASTSHLRADGNLLAASLETETGDSTASAYGAIIDLNNGRYIGGWYNIQSTYDICATTGRVLIAESQYTGGGPVAQGRAKLLDIHGNTLATIPNPAPVAYDRFGTTCAIKGDWMCVATWQDDQTGYNLGTAYVYSVSEVEAGNTTPKFVLPNTYTTNIQAYGRDVYIYGDHLYVGSDGGVKVFKLTSTSATYLTNLAIGGVYLTIQRRGYILAVGTTVGTTLTEAGYMRFWYVDGDNYTFVQEISNPDNTTYDKFGEAFALMQSTPASTLKLVAAAPDSDVGSTNSGSIYVFDGDPSWVDPEFNEVEYKATHGVYLNGTELKVPANIGSTLIDDTIDYIEFKTYHTLSEPAIRKSFPLNNVINTRSDQWSISFLVYAEDNNRYGTAPSNSSNILTLYDDTYSSTDGGSEYRGMITFSLSGSALSKQLTMWMVNANSSGSGANINLQNPYGWNFVMFSGRAGTTGSYLSTFGLYQDPSGAFSTTIEGNGRNRYIANNTATNTILYNWSQFYSSGRLSSMTLGGGYNTNGTGNTGFNGKIANIKVHNYMLQTGSSFGIPTHDIYFDGVDHRNTTKLVVRNNPTNPSDHVYPFLVGSSSRINPIEAWTFPSQTGERSTFFSDDGMIAYSMQSNTLFKHTLSQPYDIRFTTATDSVNLPQFGDVWPRYVRAVSKDGNFFYAYGISETMSTFDTYQATGSTTLDNSYDRSAAFSTCGNWLFTCQLDGNGLFKKFALSTPFDVTTKTLVQTSEAFGLDYIIAVQPKFIIGIGVFDGKPVKVSMTEDYDLSTAVGITYTLNVPSTYYSYYGAGFNSDGSTWTNCNMGGTARVYYLSQPYDIETATHYENYTGGSIGTFTRSARSYYSTDLGFAIVQDGSNISAVALSGAPGNFSQTTPIRTMIAGKTSFYSANYIVGDDLKGRFLITSSTGHNVIEGAPAYEDQSGGFDRKCFMIGKASTPFSIQGIEWVKGWNKLVSTDASIYTSPYIMANAVGKTFAHGSFGSITETGLGVISTSKRVTATGTPFGPLGGPGKTSTTASELGGFIYEYKYPAIPIWTSGHGIAGLGINEEGDALLVYTFNSQGYNIQQFQMRNFDPTTIDWRNNSISLKTELIVGMYTEGSPLTFASRGRRIYVPLQFNGGTGYHIWGF